MNIISGVFMKQKLLIITVNSTTKTALKSYLTSILGQYLDIEACLVHKVSYDLMKNYDLVLFSADLTKNLLNDNVLKPDITHLVSIRTLNHTYLNKILTLPPCVSVYLVNDSKQSAESVIEQLGIFGFSQYHFIPYYPGCRELDYTIQYAVTVGEDKLVPPFITTIIDISNRIVDISTIIEIIIYFDLPSYLVNEITKNYINHIVQILKLTNIQLNQAINTIILTQNIVNNLNTGLCLLDKNGFIKSVNPSFIKMLELHGGHLVDTSLNFHLQKYNISFEWKTQKNSLFYVKNIKNEIIKLNVQEIEDNKHSRLLLINSNTEITLDKVTKYPIQNMSDNFSAEFTFKDYITIEHHSKELLEYAKSISLTDYSVLIQGENGTGKSILAQSIHNNSKRSEHPFVSLNISAASHDILELELLGYDKNVETNDLLEEKPGVFELANKGTLFLEGIHDLSYDLQCALERILEKKVVRRIGSYNDVHVDVRIITSSTKDLFSMISSGQFREDLFYNINVVSLETIPLRNRAEDIPLHFNNCLKNVFNNSNLTLEGLCTDSLKNFLLSYSWPGNVKEINNLCKYFSCIRKHEKLIMKDLPRYLLSQFTIEQKKLSLLERQIIHIISKSPKIGRSKIQQLLASKGTEISEGKVRGLLNSLSEMKLIKMNRTKGGCEITEEGELYL